MATSSLILQSYFKTASDSKKDKHRYNKKVKELLKANRGADFLTPLSFYLSILENTEHALFPFMTIEQKKCLLRDLQVTLLLLMTQKHYERQHQKTENLKIYDQQLKKCRQLIDALQYEQERKARKEKLAPEYGYASEDHPVQYLGFSYGQYFAGLITSWMNSRTKSIKNGMGALNEKRLYWVWGSSLLKTLLELIPSNFFNIGDAKQAIRKPDPYTGYTSWILYYFRFALNLSLLLRHTIAGPWMSKEEKKTPWTERFLTQWAQRKFTLLNDSLWATANMVCFFWLTGKGTLGTWGDLLTLGLLIFDISMAVWEFAEQQAQYNKAILDYNTNITQLKITKKQLEEAGQSEENNKKLFECNLQLQALKRAKKQCQREWSYQKIHLINSLSYALGLMLAFALLTTPFLPLTVPVALVLGVLGAVLCFALTIIYNAVRGGIEVHKAKASQREAQEEYSNKVTLFFSNNPPLNDNEKRLLFLEIKQLKAETRYQEDMVILQSIRLTRSILFEALLPAVILSSLVFLPTGVGLGIITAFLVLSLASYAIIERAFAAKKTNLGQFNEGEFQYFCKNPGHWATNPSQSQGFFSPSMKKAEAESPQRKRTEQEDDDVIDLSMFDDKEIKGQCS